MYHCISPFSDGIPDSEAEKYVPPTLSGTYTLSPATNNGISAVIDRILANDYIYRNTNLLIQTHIQIDGQWRPY